MITLQFASCQVFLDSVFWFDGRRCALIYESSHLSTPGPTRTQVCCRLTRQCSSALCSPSFQCLRLGQHRDSRRAYPHECASLSTTHNQTSFQSIHCLPTKLTTLLTCDLIQTGRRLVLCLTEESRQCCPGTRASVWHVIHSCR